MKKKLVLIFCRFELQYNVEGKDVFLIPYYLGKINNMDVEIVTTKSQSNEHINSLRGVKINKLKYSSNKNIFKFYLNWRVWKYLLFYSRSIDVLIEFHFMKSTLLNLFVYKLLNRKGKAILKADGGEKIIEAFSSKSIIYRFFLKTIINKIDLITIETSNTYNKIIKEIPSMYIDKFCFLPNGFDEELLNSMNIDELDVNNKSNYIITVGRLGSYLKNNEMLLDALDHVDLKDWKVYFIGDIQDSDNNFKNKVELFYKKNQDKIKSVIFTGRINSKEELWNYYNKSKVFILTSRSESFGLVLCEAARFYNYILSTDVGAAKDIISLNNRGALVGDSNELAIHINKIINGNINIENNFFDKQQIENLSWEKILRRIEI